MVFRSLRGILPSLLALAAPAVRSSEGTLRNASPERFLVSRWSLAEGLPQSSPNALALGAQGYLWVGTEQGLARFDGVRFTVWDTRHGLAGERVVQLLATASGLWVATVPGGLSFFADGRFTPVLPNVTVLSLVEAEPDVVWIGTPSGLARARRRAAPEPVPLPGGGPVHDLLVDGDGALLVAHADGVARRDTQGSWSELELGGALPPISALVRGGDALWLAASNGVWRLVESDAERVTAAAGTNPGVAVDASGDAWLWSADGGVRRWRDGRVHELPELAGTDVLVFDVLPDGDDTVWIGSGTEGLIRMRRALIDAVTMDDGLPAWSVHGVLEDHRGRLWVGSLGAGLTRLDAGGLRTYGTGDGLPDRSVLSIAEDAAGRIYVGTTRGIAVGDGETFGPLGALASVGLEPSTIAALTPEPDGSLLFSTAGKVFRHHQGRTRELFGRVFANGGVEAMHRDRDGALWIAGNGVCRAGAAGLECYGEEDGLPPHLVRTLVEAPRGELWLGTYGGGLCRVEDGPSFRCISEEQGLPHRTVHHALFDPLGWVWLPSNRGLGRARRADLERAFDDTSYTLRADVFGLEDGLPDLELNGGVSPPGALLADGRLALPTMRGLALVDPRAADAASANAPTVHLERVDVDGAELPAGASQRLPAGSDRITFHYTGIHPRAPSSVRFRYRLDGHDPTWLAAGDSRSVSYTDLEPGGYRFRVQGSVGGSPWSDEAATTIELPPFFWQTPWFTAAIVLAIAAALALLYRMRVRRLLELERVRLRIASDLHDELSAELSSIALSSAIARRRTHLEEPLHRRLEEIESTARAVASGLRDLVWAINPEHDTLAATVARMRSTAAQLLEDLDWSFEESWTRDGGAVAMATRRDLYLIFKEALTNVARHARASRVTVRLERDDDRLHFEIEDDGVGFDSLVDGPGSGLDSMRRRARRVGAQLEVDTRPGAGTSVRLKLPF